MKIEAFYPGYFAKRSVWIVSLLCTAVAGCGTLKTPSTLGEKARDNIYGYTPLDPLPVIIPAGAQTTDVLKALPDETMRLAIGQFERGGKITYGPASLGYSGNSYVIILDYIKYTTKSFGVVKDGVTVREGRTNVLYALAGPNTKPEAVVPAYVGIGLRLTANITVHEGKVELANLVAVGAAAQAKKVSGTLIIQSLGISGESVSSAIPMPSEINTTTIQSALVALGTIKSQIYAEKTAISPRVLAVYNTLGGGTDTINHFITLLLQEDMKLNVEKSKPGP